LGRFTAATDALMRGEPTIIMRGAHAIRLYPLLRK
jgi:hypothetical protein